MFKLRYGAEVAGWKSECVLWSVAHPPASPIRRGGQVVPASVMPKADPPVAETRAVLSG